MLSKSVTPISKEGQLDLTETLMKHQNEHLTYSVCKRQLGELHDFQDSFQKLQTVERVDHLQPYDHVDYFLDLELYDHQLLDSKSNPQNV